MDLMAGSTPDRFAAVVLQGNVKQVEHGIAIFDAEPGHDIAVTSGEAYDKRREQRSIANITIPFDGI